MGQCRGHGHGHGHVKFLKTRLNPLTKLDFSNPYHARVALQHLSMLAVSSVCVMQSFSCHIVLVLMVYGIIIIPVTTHVETYIDYLVDR